MAKTKELKVVVTLDDQFSNKTKKIEKSTNSIGAALKKATVASAAFTAAFALGLRSVVKAASEMESSIIGLSTVANAFDVDAKEATQAAKNLAEDGLLSVKDAAGGLKNLLASGLSLPQAIKLMDGFKDSAAFNRQGTLSFGRAIVGATEGIKNQNSVMVDNAGITKNLSVIMEEAGFKMKDLSVASTKVAATQALYNGLLKETAIFSGDAAKATKTYQGQTAALKVAIFNLKVAIGKNLLPALATLIEKHLVPFIERTEELVGELGKSKLAVIILAGAIMGALVPAAVAAATAFGAMARALAPFILAGGAIAAIVGLLDLFLKETTGFTLLEQLEASFILLGEAVSTAGDKLKELPEKTSTVLEAMKERVTSNMELIKIAFTTTFDFIKERFGIWAEFLKETATTTFNFIRERFKNWADLSLNDWAEFFGLLEGSLETRFKTQRESWRIFFVSLGLLFDQTTESLTEKWTKWLAALGVKTAIFSVEAKTSWENMKTSLSTATKTLAENVKVVWGLFLKGLKVLMEKTVAAIKVLWKAFLTSLKTFIEGIGPAIKEAWRLFWTGMLETVVSKATAIIGFIDSIIKKIGELVGKFKKGRELGIKFPAFQHGGTVPGGFNQAVPAILHGGERVIPKTGLDANGGSVDNSSVTVNFNGNIGQGVDLEAITTAVRRAIDRESNLFAMGVL